MDHFLLVLLGLTSLPLVLAASKPDCSNPIEIRSQADATSLSSCDTISGTLTISPAASGSITLSNVENLRSGLTIDNTDRLDSFIAPDLETVTGLLSVRNNKALVSLQLGSLGTVDGEVRIRANPHLTNLRFNELDQVAGGLYLDGPFDSISFPNLESVQGATEITSSGSLNCNSLSPSEDNDNTDVFNGSFSCSNSTTSLSPGAKAGIAIAVIVVVAILAVLIWLYCRRRKRRRLDVAAVGSSSPLPRSVSPPDNDNKPPSDVDGDVDVEKDAPSPIPRKPLSLPSPPPPPPPPTSETHNDIPRSLIPGMPRVVPQAPPSETDVPMLDSEHVHEVSAERDRDREAGPFELEAPVRGLHMRVLEPQVAA
ncbi:hypothetical protein P168DRAFT_283085 [Aspergillus campestris IBT 28561]|uniref:Receptor L-domain domain-containing protein n=1 Tax=Aspergillus campestris (strain IBT 28561) TaxID=1392248 RepID=A0A2I1D0D8_ASPC2|nr:uncharacterized protein P168DRAFT_283085 [Aspergillus campestris IBT 28561]PKY03340.1 hypothetical protein P168DRAFT_283085 [Aspergillus campestris IBT 28561]